MYPSGAACLRGSLLRTLRAGEGCARDGRAFRLLCAYVWGLHKAGELQFWFRRRKVAGHDLALESDFVVRAVAEGLVRRMAAAAQREGGAARKAEGRPLRVHNLEVSFDAKRAVVQRSDLRTCH